MKILIVSEDIPHPNLGGLGKHALALAHELHRCGHGVDLLGNADCDIASYPEQAGPGKFFSAISGHQRGWKQQSIGAFHPLANSLNARALARAIKNYAAGYDVIHYHGHLPWVAGLLPTKLPFTQTRHDQGGDCMLRTRFRPEGVLCEYRQPEACARCATPNPNSLQRGLSNWGVRRMRRQTSAAFEQRPVIFVSQFLRQAFSLVSKQAPQGEVIHNATNIDALQKSIRTSLPEVGDRWPIELFAAGAIATYKGFGPLLELLRQSGFPAGWRLTIAGSGPELALLQNEYVESNIRFLGWCEYPKVLAYTLHADAVVVPSIWEEPCATTVLEALALGRVVYALRRGGTPEIAACVGDSGKRLRLFNSMPQLVAALLNHRDGAVDPENSIKNFPCSIANMTQQVLTHYSRFFGVK